MTSRKVELTHEAMLDALIAQTGFHIERETQEPTESSLSETVPEEMDVITEEAEQLAEEKVEEEIDVIFIEEISDDVTEIFPSPSLRRVLPEKIRKYEGHNRIHVLPEQFRTDIDPLAIPKIASTAPKRYIEILADILGCTKYQSSLPEYWFLDTMANLLRRAQEDELDRQTQAILMLWFCEWIKEMQHFDAANRQRMMKRFKDNMLAAASFIAESEVIPTPAQIGVFYKADPESPVNTSPKSTVPQSVKLNTVTFEGAGFQCSLVDLTKIIHYIFDLSDFQYDLVRSVITHSPEYVLIDAPYQLEVPKKLYVKLKPLKKETKKEPKASPKPKKGAAIPNPPQYVQLMQFKAKEESLLAEQEEEAKETWNKRSNILPLNCAGTEEFFNKYWPPPPPPPEPEPPVVPETKPKGKAKGKK